MEYQINKKGNMFIINCITIDFEAPFTTTLCLAALFLLILHFSAFKNINATTLISHFDTFLMTPSTFNDVKP